MHKKGMLQSYALDTKFMEYFAQEVIQAENKKLSQKKGIYSIMKFTMGY